MTNGMKLKDPDFVAYLVTRGVRRSISPSTPVTRPHTNGLVGVWEITIASSLDKERAATPRSECLHLYPCESVQRWRPRLIRAVADWSERAGVSRPQSSWHS